MSEAKKEMELLAVLHLASDLRALYQSDTKDLAQTRARYAEMLRLLAQFVEHLDVPARAQESLSALARLLTDVDAGSRPPLFQPPEAAARKSGRRGDPAEIWHLRGAVAVGFQCLANRAGKQATSGAATAARIGKKYRSLSRLLRPGTTLQACIAGWNTALSKDARELRAGNATRLPASAVEDFQTQVAIISSDEWRDKPARLQKLGERLLTAANDRAAKLPPW